MPVIRAVNDEWKSVLCRGLTEEDTERLSAVLEKMVANIRGEEGE